jgi:DNA-binding HxlR family transcriptional regulator
MGERKISSTNFLNETFLEERCVLNKVLKIIGKRWMPEILLLIENKVNRFSTLKECLEGISDNVLSTSLNELVKLGITEKVIYQEMPLRVEYNLSESGIGLVTHLHSICRWGKVYVEKWNQ